MILICENCGRDLNEIGHDNMSCEPFHIICEDCSGHTARVEEMKDILNEIPQKAD